MQRLLLCLCLLAASIAAHAAETIPAAPTRLFNDFAQAVKPETAERLNRALADFERQTSTQVVAAIYPKLQSDSAVDDYAQRVFRAWKIGQKGTDNGVLLLVFIQDRKIWIQTGRGAEGALPDATCKDIVADQMTPRFKQGDLDGGMTAGVTSVMQALKGEYKGAGATQYEREQKGGRAGGFPWVFLLLFAVLFLLPMFSRRRGGMLFSPLGPMFMGGGFGGFGGSSGGSSGGGGGDFFSGGGGSSGGGGAGGDW